MSKSNDLFDNYYDDVEEIELYMEKSAKATSSQGKKFRARRQIEEMRENKRLQRQIDSLYYD